MTELFITLSAYNQDFYEVFGVIFFIGFFVIFPLYAIIHGLPSPKSPVEAQEDFVAKREKEIRELVVDKELELEILDYTQYHHGRQYYCPTPERLKKYEEEVETLKDDWYSLFSENNNIESFKHAQDVARMLMAKRGKLLSSDFVFGADIVEGAKSINIMTENYVTKKEVKCPEYLKKVEFSPDQYAYEEFVHMLTVKINEFHKRSDITMYVCSSAGKAQWGPDWKNHPRSETRTGRWDKAVWNPRDYYYIVRGTFLPF